MSEQNLDFSKSHDLLFRDAVQLYNNNDLVKSKLIFEYLNFVIPNNDGIINNLVNCYKSLTLFDKIEIFFYNYVSSKKVEANLLNTYVSSFLEKYMHYKKF